MKIPPWHEWDEIEPCLWQCKWCKGFARSESEPDKEAIAYFEPSADATSDETGTKA